MRVAVVGSGVSGLAASWVRGPSSNLVSTFSSPIGAAAERALPHEVELFEKEGQLGGHANTIWVQNPGKEGCWVESAFVLFNEAAWPNFYQFLRYRSLPLRTSDGSFSYSHYSGRQWASFSPWSLFPKWKHLLSNRPWSMLRDILWFNATAIEVLRSPEYEGVSTGDYLAARGYSEAFQEDYLLPLIGAIFLLPPQRIAEDYPIVMLVRSMYNMGLLQLWGKAPWYTIDGGSRLYIESIAQNLRPDRTHVNTGIVSATRSGDKVVLRDERGIERSYDHVILATHCPVTLEILRSGGLLTEVAEEVLSAPQFHSFSIVAHSESKVLSDEGCLQAAWNSQVWPRGQGQLDFVDPEGRSSGADHFSVTFDVNRLQQFPLHKHGHILGTLNPSIPIPASKHLATILFAQAIPSHRLYTAQKRLHELDEDLSRQGISAVGAWRGAGIHEDGWVAGIRAAEKLGGKMPFLTLPRDREVARMGVVEWLRGLWVGPVRVDAMESKEKLL
ncbi:hypothetical protein EHS25_002599 [Saitozyma podzolica]|uniref:Amine oxidase domain-containing protein n=1 Tax=Saitozyma podzolica TaxID=1890683 RepID=A0A427YD99_9TREE|nr:hypothetical protein EHS25_002599 [Saitozyma podzolica]